MEKNINLILQGGGIKGLAYIGALKYLEQNNYKINYIAGSSIGAIIGVLIASGYTSYELELIINNININDLILKQNAKDIIKNKCIYNNKNLEKYIENLLLKKQIRTFKDLKIGNNYKVIFISTSIKHKKIFVLPYDLKYLNIDIDSFPIAKAVIMSASVPILFPPYKLNNNYFYDGGLSDNYPKWCFSNGVALRLTEENINYNKIKQKLFGLINNPNNIKEIYINTKGFKSFDFIYGINNRYELYKRGYLSLKYNNLNI